LKGFFFFEKTAPLHSAYCSESAPDSMKMKPVALTVVGNIPGSRDHQGCDQQKAD